MSATVGWSSSHRSLHQQQTQGHDDHAANETENAVVSLAISPTGWQQSIQTDVHHDTRHTRKEHAHHLRWNGTGSSSNKKPHREIGDARTDRFGQTA